MMDAYKQIHIEPDCIKYSGFSMPYSTFESNVMQQGDCNAPSTFQHVLMWVFCDWIGLDVHVWFDDISIGMNTIQEHNECIQVEKPYISRKKFEPFTPVLDILGCKIDSNGIHADSDKLSKIRNWHIPKDHTEVLQFLGLIKYLSQFLLNIRAYTAPLQNICTNHMPFQCSLLHQKCFEHVKLITCKTPILKPIIWDIPLGAPHYISH